MATARAARIEFLTLDVALQDCLSRKSIAYSTGCAPVLANKVLFTTGITLIFDSVQTENG